jgi:hypothetical protein
MGQDGERSRRRDARVGGRECLELAVIRMGRVSRPVLPNKKRAISASSSERGGRREKAAAKIPHVGLGRTTKRDPSATGPAP